MKNLKFVGGILLVALALILVLLALFFPYNMIFTALWDMRIFTFRGESSLIVIYIASALALAFGGYLLAKHVKGKREGV